jgi:hypothetical protein
MRKAIDNNGFNAVEINGMIVDEQGVKTLLVDFLTVGEEGEVINEEKGFTMTEPWPFELTEEEIAILQQPKTEQQ